MALASLCGNAVVAAAVTDVWESARHRLARLLGRGDPERVRIAGRRLDETRSQLAAASGVGLVQKRAELAARWTTRLADLLEDDPGVEPELQELVAMIKAALPTVGVLAADHSLASGGNLSITASGQGIAIGVLHGTISAINQVVYQRREVSGLPISLSPRPALLAGREGLIAVLHSRLTVAGIPHPRIVALCGLGGV